MGSTRSSVSSLLIEGRTKSNTSFRLVDARSECDIVETRAIIRHWLKIPLSDCELAPVSSNVADRASGEQTVICVLGMHRSGTSCLAGTLEEAGIYLGDVSRRNRHNPKGNRENSRIIALHDDLLAQCDGSWDRPPQHVRWSEHHRRICNEIIQGYAGVRRWGFKDPRTLLTLPGWLELLPRMRLVGIFRHPRLVAVSLQKRNGFTIEQGLQLWTHYNERLMEYHEQYRFPLISFDLPTEEFRNHLVRLMCTLDIISEQHNCTRESSTNDDIIPSSDHGRLRFYEPSLRHAKLNTDTIVLPRRTADILAYLDNSCL